MACGQPGQPACAPLPVPQGLVNTAIVCDIVKSSATTTGNANTTVQVYGKVVDPLSN